MAAARPRIVVLGDFEGALTRFFTNRWDALRQRSDLVFDNRLTWLSEDEIFQAVQDADAIALVRDRVPFRASLLNRLDKLKYFIFTGERNGTLDAKSLWDKNIPVAYTKGGPSKQSTAELSWALVMASTKRIVEQNRLLLDGQWRNENSLLPTLEGQRMGIIGLGHIGGRMAQFAKAFGMEVVVWSPNMTPERAQEAGVECSSVSLEELLSTSKVVSMHLGYGPAVKGLLNAERLALMRPDSVLVNTSRSGLIVTSDLVAALKAGRPGQAAVDVYDYEPLPADHEFRQLPNLLMTPHLGFAVENVFSTFSDGLTVSLEAWLDGKPSPLPYLPPASSSSSASV